MAGSPAQTWLEWHEDFVIRGNNDEKREKKGSLTFLGPSRQKPLARVNLYNLGVFSLASDRPELNADQVRRMIAELYCERMEFLCKPE